MPQSSIYSLFTDMGSEVVLSYKGEVHTELLESIYSSMDDHFVAESNSKQRKRFNNVLIEALQNVFHHQSEVDTSSIKDPDPSGFIILDVGPKYKIVTGNYIYNNIIKDLEQKIEEVNKLDADQLRVLYQETLAATELSPKGGAGLGLIEMVRRSGHPLEYEFRKINDDISFFCLSVTLSKK